MADFNNYSIKFKEEQAFRSPWLIALFAFIAVSTGVSVISLMLASKDSTALVAASSTLGILCLSLWLLYSIKLRTEIRTDGFYYQMFPFHFKMKKIAWDEVELVKVRKYKPILEYGGWGVRFSLNSGRAYNIAGNQGIQLCLSNSKMILFGTQKPEEAAAAIDEVYHKAGD